jgi:hypothetical protein
MEARNGNRESPFMRLAGIRIIEEIELSNLGTNGQIAL